MGLFLRGEYVMINEEIVEYLLTQGGEEFKLEDGYWENWKITLGLTGGCVEYLPWTKQLYIWSGLGMGYYSSCKVVEDDNGCYGFEVNIENLDQLKAILAVLIK